MRIAKGADMSNWGGVPHLDVVAKAVREEALEFFRCSTYDIEVARGQCNVWRAAGARIEAPYCIRPDHVIKSIGFAQELGVNKVVLDVEEEMFVTPIQLQWGLDRLAEHGVGRAIYTRFNFWQDNFSGFQIPADVELWIAYGLGGEREPTFDDFQFIAQTAVDEKMPVPECWQYHGTISDYGFSCDLDAKLVDWEAVTPVALPAPVEPLPAHGGSVEAGVVSPDPAPASPPSPTTAQLVTWQQYAAIVINGVGVMRFGGSELDDNGLSKYPGRIALLRGQDYYWVRTTKTGGLWLSTEEGD